MESREKYDVIPDEMRRLAHWVLWGVSPEDPKAPYTTSVLTSKRKAAANNPATWGSFADAVAAAARLGRGGIGFEFGVEPCGIVGLDLDHVINDAGELANWAAEVVSLMDSYTEYSPSGRGLHILCSSNEPLSAIGKRNKNDSIGLEIYDHVRYFTVTGKPYGDVKPLAERTTQLREVYRRYMPKESEKPKANPATGEASSYATGNLSDAELWERMFDSEQGEKIRALYDGEISGYGSPSQADSALCCYLAFWTQGDGGRMDRMFRQSGLMREKWERKDYRERTIEHAIEITPSGEKIKNSTPYTNCANPESVHCANQSESESGGREEEREEQRADESPEGEEDKAAPHIKTVSEYVDDFLRELDESREGKAIPTGFAGLDELLDGGLYPGLYFLGAISSLGKTTLALQVADNIAKNGQGVMIFSLEMSRSELMAKTLSRESLMRDIATNKTTTNALTTRGVLRALFHGFEKRELLIGSAIESYRDWGRNLTIVEGVGDVGIKTGENSIKATLEVYKSEHNGKLPVVVIDYLQILAPYNERYTDKQNIDHNVTWLKRLSRYYQIPVIGISSFNRENYTAPVNMAAFKESGAIEYSSDVLIGLQIAGIDKASGESDKDYKERFAKTLESVATAKANGEPIGIEAKILKHRNGRTGTVTFSFYPRYNFFQEYGAVL